jgi:hypothetical protein
LVTISLSSYSGWIRFDTALVAKAALDEVGFPQGDPIKQGNEFVEESKRLLQYSPEMLAQAVNNPSAGGRVWMQFYRYRATIRAQLRALCRSHNIGIDNTTSMQAMVDSLYKAEVITAELKTKILRISTATFTAQWGTGDVPTPSEARFVAEEAPGVIQQLADASQR